MRPRKHATDLPPCVYARHGAFYYVKRGVWLPLGKTKGSALRAYAAIIEAPKGGMAELIDDALSHLLPKVSKNTAKQYRACAIHLKRWLAEFEPHEIRPRDIALLKRHLASTPNYANRCLSLLRQIFAHALEEQLVDSNPCVGVRRHAERKRSRLLTPEEYAAIYAKAGERLQIIMDLLIRTGQRIGDVLKIRRADLTDVGIRFEQQKTGAKGVVPWTLELRAVVERARALPGSVKAMTHLLNNRRGKPPDYSTVKIQWDKARKAAGVDDARIHDLRAFAATWAKKQGKNPTALLMHTSAAQTARYLRAKDEPVAEGPSFDSIVGPRKA